MNFTDIFIRRPVLATVVSLLILVLGLRSLLNLPINQYPRTQNAIATISTVYYGADALTEFSTQVNSVRNQLPVQSQQPVLTVQTGQTTDAMYIGFYSDTLPSNNVTDFLAREVKRQLDSIQGVQTAELLGARPFALRAWLDVAKLAAHGLTAADVSAALAANNVLAGVGSSKGQMVRMSLTAGTDLHALEE